MTEYDYSPEAWEHYRAQQARVSKWVSQTTAHAHYYSDPFTSSPTLRDRSFYNDTEQAPRRPAPTRSKTLNLPYPRQVDPYISHPIYDRERGRSRSLENRSSSSSAKPRSSSTSRTTPSSNYKLPARPYTLKVVYPPPPPPPHHSRHHAPPHSYQKRPLPVRQHTSPAHYYPGESHAPRHRPSYLPPPRPGQTYFIPRGRVEYEYRPPVPKKPQPLIRRLFGFIGNGRYEQEKLYPRSRKRSSY